MAGRTGLGSSPSMRREENDSEPPPELNEEPSPLWPLRGLRDLSSLMRDVLSSTHRASSTWRLLLLLL